MPRVTALLQAHVAEKRVFEIGFGNGANALFLTELGYKVTGVEPSAHGLALASKLGLDLHPGSTEDDLARIYGQFPCILSLEVIEHVYSPAQFAERVSSLLQPGGIAVISTPYHGYLKNLALAITGKMDAHFTALWEGGHIKFFSRKTLGELFAKEGLQEVDFYREGRIPFLAKSMIGVYRKGTEV